MKIVGVIPARLKSKRLKDKMLLPLGGKPLVWWVWKAATKVRGLDRVVVATDDRGIFDAMSSLGADCLMTSKAHRSGTDRLGEVSRKLPADGYINIQGDEPLMDPRNIGLLAAELRRNRRADVVTLITPFTSARAEADPNCVKAIAARDGRALYFTRAVVPYDRDGSGVGRFKHLGLYGYRRAALRKIVRLPQSRLEKAEKLEQLRFLENGFAVYTVVTERDSVGVDTKEDYLKVKKIVGRLNGEIKRNSRSGAGEEVER